MSGTDIVFEVDEDELDGGCTASALGFGIHAQGGTPDELRGNFREAMDCYFDDSMERPRLIRLHDERDEVLMAWGSRATTAATRSYQRVADWVTRGCVSAARTCVSRHGKVASTTRWPRCTIRPAR